MQDFLYILNMLKHISNSYYDSKHLIKKSINILVTNLCNVNCKNCSQMCGLFPKKEIWHIPIDQLEDNIVKLETNYIGIFGGEPTTHPEWDKIVELFKKYRDITFNIYSNGLIKLIKLDNTTFFISKNRKDIGRQFMPTLTAPIDIIKKNDKLIYWEMAKKNCHMWNKCRSIVYDNKCYACEPAAAFERMKLGKNNWNKCSGWEVKKNCFKKTESEIRNQLVNFCYRCGWCLDIAKKDANLHFNATSTNMELINNIEL